MKCPTCEGYRGYQPLFGPFQPCSACNRTGEKVEQLIVGSNITVSAKTLASWGGFGIQLPPSVPMLPFEPKQFKDEVPKTPNILIWDGGTWVGATLPDWANYAKSYPNFWWIPQPPAPPGVTP